MTGVYILENTPRMEGGGGGVKNISRCNFGEKRYVTGKRKGRKFKRKWKKVEQKRRMGERKKESGK